MSRVFTEIPQAEIMPLLSAEKYLPKLGFWVDILLKQNTQPAMLNYAILMFIGRCYINLKIKKDFF